MGSLFMLFHPFFFVYAASFAGRVSLSHISEKKRVGEKKLSGGVRDGTEQQGTKTGERESGRDFFFEGLSGHVE